MRTIFNVRSNEELKEKFRILRYYTYPCVVRDPVVMYDSNTPTLPTNVPTAEKFFNYVLTVAQDLYDQKNTEHRKKLADNKIAFAVEYKETGTQFYVGSKDGKYTIGLVCVDLGYSRMYDFETNIWSNK